MSRPRTMQQFIAITKALADENRVRILLALRYGELCVCQLTALLDLAPSTVSKHIAILRQAGLVTLRKDGRWAYYRLSGDNESPLVQRSIAWVLESAGSTRQAVEDNKRLRVIVNMGTDTLCRK